MGMTRAAAAQYLAGTLAELLTDAGLGNDDASGELGEVIDDALLMVGTAYSGLATATVADADVLGFRRVLTYAALLRIDQARGDRASSFSEGGTSASWSRDGWSKRLEAAATAAKPFITGSGEWGSGTLTLDFIEPLVTA